MVLGDGMSSLDIYGLAVLLVAATTVVLAGFAS
jgi:hypothetical protein